ncbi:MAG: hypothetical protein LBU85_05330 [Treponema sp.]|nr:hypothetical protein [Treponema sp.]
MMPDDSINNAINWIAKYGKNDDILTFTIRNDVQLEPSVIKRVSLKIQGDEYMRTISLKSKGTLFLIEDGGTVILGKNVTLKGISGNNSPLLVIDSNKLIMEAGSIIRDNTNLSGAAGIYISLNASFIMNGGEISNNITNNGNGGGVYVRGSFRMNEGIISGNTADLGGGVYCAVYKSPYTGTTYYGYFFKPNTGGIIYGSNEGNTALRNVSSNGNNGGHAVYFPTNPIKKRNTTVGATDILDSTINGTSGGWE